MQTSKKTSQKRFVNESDSSVSFRKLRSIKDGMYIKNIVYFILDPWNKPWKIF